MYSLKVFQESLFIVTPKGSISKLLDFLVVYDTN